MDATSNTPPNRQDWGVIEYLRDCVPAEFPADGSRTQNHDYSSDLDVYTFHLAKETYTALDLFAKAFSIDIGIAFIATIRILHFRYTGINHAAIGWRAATLSSTTGDSTVESARTLVVSLPIDGDESFFTVTKRTAETVAEAARYPEAAFVNAITELGWNKYGAITPILMSVENSEGSGDVPVLTGREHIDLEWRFKATAETLRCDLIYDCGLFKMESIWAFANNLSDILACFAREPGLAIEDASFSHALEQLQQARIPIHPPPKTLQGSLAEVFTAAAKEHHSKLGLVDKDLNFTYHDLDVLSSLLAKKIADVAQGQDKCELISFCIPPSALAVLAILGIIKFGAAYVPLDVRFPEERLEALLCDSGARMLITTSDSPTFATKQLHVIRLDISDFLNGWKSSPSTIRTAEALPSYPSQTDLAYVMYTSGSTGKPKGVAMAQSSVLAFVTNEDTFGFGPGHIVAQINNLAWDASVIDIWGSLLSGALVVCFDRFDILDPPVLAKQFKMFKIDCCFMSPALFIQMVDVAPDLFSTLRTFIIGGEPFYYESLWRARKINPSMKIVSSYGPTETCVITTTLSLHPHDEMSETGLVPIGRPLKTAQVLVVDKKGRLVPPGIIGELVIGGEGVARGYLNRPVETSQAFVDMAFEGLDTPCSTFYHSGDAVKWRPDGELQFVSRLNIGQVKIRGQRLELAEVEATIVRTGLVKSAAVTYFKPQNGHDAFLVAYVVLDTKSPAGDKDESVAKIQAETDSGSSKLVETWRELYDDMYSGYDITEARAQFLGWDSMVTGLPIPQDEMMAWLHDTLRPFFQQRPRTVFEVGCGIGIFLHEMAPFVDHLWAIEPSGEAVQKLKAQLRANHMDDKFSIWHGPADRIPQLPPFQSEFVLINSVVQYLPSEAYLREALVHIIDKCARGSRILLGDIRSLPFDDLLGIDIILHEWKDKLEAHTIQDLRDRIAMRNRNRTELLLDPTFFFNLQRAVPAISHVEIVPKIMEKSNELSQYRYQVILHVQEELTMIVPEEWHDYKKLGWNPASFEGALHAFVAGEETILAVEGVPNKFLGWESAVASAVFSPSSDAGSSLANIPSRQSSLEIGWSPWDLERLAEQLGMAVRLSFARQSQSTEFDVVFIKKSAPELPYIAFKSASAGDVVIPGFSSRALDLKVDSRPEWEVLDRLKAALPTYMIPEAIYSISSLPLLTSGKLDRRQVSAMAEADAGRGFNTKVSGEVTSPANPLEARICDIFGDTLSCGTVSPTVDFFSIGGHSLLAARLKAAIEAEFGVRIAIQDIFLGPTPRQVASKIRTLPSTADLGVQLGGMGRPEVAEGQYYPLSFAQGRLWFLAQASGPDDVSYNSPLVWRLSGNLQVEALQNTIREIISRHHILRTIFVEVDGVPKTRVLNNLPLLSVVDVPSGTRLEELQDLVKNFVMRPFKLDSEPAFRACLFKMSSAEAILALSMHHIIWDGYSIDVIRDELSELYRCFSLGKKPSLPPLPVQYKEFAEWQHSDDFEKLIRPQMEYWKTHLHGCQPAELPTDYPRPPHRTGRADSYILPFKPGLLDRLEDICQQERVSLFMWFLTLFRVVHYQLTGQEDASLGYPMANRNRLDTAKMLGFFVNTQVFRLKVHPGVTFLDLLQQTRLLLLTAYKNEDVPFDQIVSALNPSRDLSRNPLVQVLCTHETAKTSAFSFCGLDVTPFGFEGITTRLDLELYFRRRDNGLWADFYYSTDLFKESTIQHFAKRLQVMLDQVMEDPHTPIIPDQGPANTIQPIVRSMMDYLHGYTPAEFPCDHVGSKIASPMYQVYHFELPRDSCAALKLLLTFRGVTEACIPLLAALRILHFRYSNSEDTAIGLQTGDANASHNTVIVRLPLSGEMTLSSAVEDTRKAVAAASKYSDIPFSEMAAELLAHKRAACDSIVHMMLSLAVNKSSGLPTVRRSRPRFNMEWQFQSVAGDLSCDLSYNPALFELDSIQAFSNNLTDIIRSFFHEPGLTVAETLFSHALEQLNQAQIPLCSPPHISRRSLAEAFRTAATEHKDRLSLADGSLLFTYRDLDILSSILAERIFDAAQGREIHTLIAFCIPPSALAILAILGIIKYGAGYVPLDVRFPRERLEMLLADSGARLLITTSFSPEIGTEKLPVTRLDISEFLSDWKSLVASWDPIASPSYARQTDLAYVMYTSGSTGRPKGVAMGQSSVVAFVSNRETFPFGPGRVVAQITNLAWDPSIIDVWCTLLSGATLICFNRYDVLDPPVLAQLFRASKIDTCFMSPALFQQMLDAAPDLFGALRTLILGGESVYYESLQKLREINSSMTIQNGYGPTETCVLTTTFTLRPQDEMPESGPMPIGWPLKTAQVLVVDKKGRLVPPGVVGELIIGGEGVAHGYLNLPTETSHAFVETLPDGLDQPCSTFYRTGDLVKWRTDAQLQFVGRLNTDQVKIRGQRVELAEIETMIIRTGLVKNAAVTYYKLADSHDAYLVAYVVESPQTPLEREDLELALQRTCESQKAGTLQRQLLDRLQASIPSFMVPQVIRSVSRLPLLPTGKLDRRQLDAQTAADAEGLRKTEQNGSFEPPRDDIEKQLCEIFERVLQRAPIYRSSDFFKNGGHSLLAQRLSLRVRKSFHISLNVAGIFEAPTPKALAEKIRTAVSELEQPPDSGAALMENGIPPLVIFSRKPNAPYLFCIPMGHGLGYTFAPLSQITSRVNIVAFNDPRYCGSRKSTSFDIDDEYNSVLRQAAYYYDRIVQNTCDLCGGTPATSPLNIMGYSFGGHVAIEVARLAQQARWAVNLFVVDSSAHSLNQDLFTGDIIVDVTTNLLGLRAQENDDKFQETARLLTTANIRSLRGYTMLPYSGHITLFVSEGNHNHSLNPLVGSLEEVVLKGTHWRLLDMATGNLPAIAEKVQQVICEA